MTALTLFYDGTCPLCVREMNALRSKDRHRQLALIDIYSEDFVAYPQIDASEANRILHAIGQDGTLWLGLDAAHQAWQLLGRGWLYAPLRWPIIRPLADRLYLAFARNRYKLSWLLTGQKRCDSGQCGISK